MQMNADLNSTAQEIAYSYLRDKILSLEFKPKTPLRAQSIAAAIGVSRTPVREALSRLEQAGLVDRGGGWGYTVRPIGYNEAMDIYRVREALEVEAAKEALPRLDALALEQLRAVLDTAGDRLRQRRSREFRENTRRFHTAIARATENRLLISMLMMIEDRIHLIGAMVATQHGERPQQSLAQNYALLEALEARDEEAVVAAVREHVSSGREVLTRYFVTGGQ